MTTNFEAIPETGNYSNVVPAPTMTRYTTPEDT
jgi:hypothetical protein